MSIVIPCEICGLAPCLHDGQDVIDHLRAQVKYLRNALGAIAVEPREHSHISSRGKMQIAREALAGEWGR